MSHSTDYINSIAKGALSIFTKQSRVTSGRLMYELSIFIFMHRSNMIIEENEAKKITFERGLTESGKTIRKCFRAKHHFHRPLCANFDFCFPLPSSPRFGLASWFISFSRTSKENRVHLRSECIAYSPKCPNEIIRIINGRVQCVIRISNKSGHVIQTQWINDEWIRSVSIINSQYPN